ncbi:MAG: glycoside hydrolase family 16 protein, partial [Bacteroidota bacterium]|nr:glycoside hydrolase family 16 protein [Bacteroidota bacterium]
ARLDSFSIEGQKVPITSASLTTEGKHEWQYGRIEVRAKIPSALGTWPAIWLLGTNHKTAGWPACGEIDMMEHVGYDPDTLHFNIHTKAYNHSKHTNKGKKVGIQNPEADYHIYTLDWTKEKLDLMLDNKVVFTYRNEGTGPDVWPYDQPFYLILNLAFGGAWGGQKGVDLKALPHKFYIDYVRVYQYP